MYGKDVVFVLRSNRWRTSVPGALLIAALCGAAVQGQSSDFLPSAKFAGTVSVSELQVSPKAKDKFERGLRSLQKNDLQQSLQQFAAAIEVAPNYYEAYYHKGVA